jgi:hypothetical protein
MRDVAVLRRLAAAALVAAAAVPLESARSGPILCTFRAVTGLPCPSCGMTRSWNAMGHGRVREASGFHLMGPVTFVAAVALVVAGDERASRALQPTGPMRPILAGIAAAWVSAWIWRLARGDRG